MTDRFRQLTLVVAASAIAVATAAGLYASSQNTAGGPPPFMGRGAPFGGMAGPFGPLRMLASRLGLSDTQKDQIKGVMQGHRDEWQALADRAVAAHKALHAAETTDPIDEAAIREHSADLATVEADIAIARAHARAEIFQFLTPDQQARAAALRSQIEQRFDERRQHFQQRSQPPAK